jgi:hypothetical protein
MGMEDRFGRASREANADASRERMKAEAARRHQEHEVDRIHAEEAAEQGATQEPQAWWRFWSR